MWLKTISLQFLMLLTNGKICAPALEFYHLEMKAHKKINARFY